MERELQRPRYRLLILGLVIIVALAAALPFAWQRYRQQAEAKRQAAYQRSKASFIPPPPRDGYIGARILKGYGVPGRQAQEDLTDLAHALKNFALLVKGDTPLPLGANEEIARALMGKNRAGLAFLPKDSRVFNVQGQIIDRWQTPLWFHASTRERIDIRSAGPDKKLWTVDDVHRRYDGYFLKPQELNPRSLNDELTAKPKARSR